MGARDGETSDAGIQCLSVCRGSWHFGLVLPGPQPLSLDDLMVSRSVSSSGQFVCHPVHDPGQGESRSCPEGGGGRQREPRGDDGESAPYPLPPPLLGPPSSEGEGIWVTRCWNVRVNMVSEPRGWLCGRPGTMLAPRLALCGLLLSGPRCSLGIGPEAKAPSLAGQRKNSLEGPRTGLGFLL